MTNPIEAACNPMKEDAMNRAEQVVRQMIAAATAELENAGNDLKIVAPYPSGNMGRAEYRKAIGKLNFYNSFCTSREGSRRINAPNLVDVNPEKVAKVVTDAREDAAFTYEAFVAKLNHKIGPVTEARLEGNHVWAYSFLYVKAAAGDECWKTQMIINVSKLGKLFNQFPTRKMAIKNNYKGVTPPER